MRDVGKTLALIIILGLPIAIIFFLKTFGENKFDLPIMHQDGPEWIIGVCANGQGQHYVIIPEELARASTPEMIKVFAIVDSAQLQDIKLLNRISSALDVSAIDVIVIASAVLDSSIFDEGIRAAKVEANQLKYFTDCSLLLKDDFNIVLVDTQNRIRGYYILSDKEEIERLIVEIKVLLHG